MPQLTPDQINKLKSLGIQIDEVKSSPFIKGESGVAEGDLDIPQKQDISPINFTTPPQIDDSISSNQTVSDFSKEKIVNCKLKIENSHSNIFPILSISGLTLLSFSGLVLFKSKSQTISTINQSNTTLPETSVSPTQVPKSIQHYLLTSQQYFTQATQNQSVDSLNQAILAATNAIKEFPNDYRGFYQRGRIYQSVLTSKPELINQVLADLTQAQKLEPTNAEITRSLASAYAVKGDAQNTISYLSQTIALEPTKAQNFYDLAKIQQQVGLLSQAVETYNKLISLVADPTQKTQVESEKSSLEKLISQNPTKNSTSTNTSPSSPLPSVDLPSSLDSPTIQAAASSGLIVAAPQDLDQVKVSNLTASNSLSGNDTLPVNTKEITITNTQVTSTSQVYVSITKGGKNQNLQVTSKSTGSFTVGLDTAISEDIEFKWWIIN
jgi:hypothetical protein